MKTVTIHEAKTHLSRLIQDALDGEVIIIAKGKRPVVELRAVSKPTTGRKIGDYSGRIELAADFNAPLTDFDEYQ